MSDATSYRILLADDYEMFRQLLKRILAERSDLEVVGEAANGLELLSLLKTGKLRPHMAIVDISMPKLGGIETTCRIKVTYPELKVLILTIYREREYIERAFSAGAEGYLLKEDANSELFSAIDTVRRGGIYISSLLYEGSGDERR